jgi:hypothetical protein
MCSSHLGRIRLSKRQHILCGLSFRTRYLRFRLPLTYPRSTVAHQREVERLVGARPKRHYQERFDALLR